MKYPKDLTDGVKKFVEFNNLRVRKISSTFIDIPNRLVYVGDATMTYYDSDKVIENGDRRGKKNSYKHDHDPGVKVYVPGKLGREIIKVRTNPTRSRTEYSGQEEETPSLLVNASTLVRLGDSLGWEFTNLDSKKVIVDATQPFPKLYCIPSGKCLVVAQGTKLIAAFCGGSLGVTARGIVG